jgi:nucleotide-binding universal stress UspA family protein
VVVGVDFSATSKRALEAAARVVAQDDGILSIVHVFNPPWARFHYRAPTEAASPRFQQQFRQELQKRLEEFCIPDDPTMVWARPKFHLVESAGHGAGLTEFTRQTGADLVVLGTRGRTNLRDVLIGSTAERVLRDAPCSILAIKPEA